MSEDDYLFVESKVRTNRLHCSACDRKIKVGELVIFKLDEDTRKMKDVYCFECKSEYISEIIEDERHPFDLD